MKTVITGIGAQYHIVKARLGRAVAMTNKGGNPQRSANEDKFALWPRHMLVADGMGGHVGGEIAANLTVATIFAQLRRVEQKAGIEASLRSAFSAAQTALIQEMITNSTLYGMGSTASLAYVAGNTLHLAHVGDSRIYCATGESVSQLTTDHALPGTNKLFRCLGGRPPNDPTTDSTMSPVDWLDRPFQVDYSTHPLSCGDWLLLCTDGLSGAFGDTLAQRLAAFRRQGKTVTEASQALMAEALHLSSQDPLSADNITLILYEHRPSFWQRFLATAIY